MSDGSARTLPKTRIEYHDAGPEENGKRRFALFWTANGKPRAQEFYADPTYCLARHPELKREKRRNPR